jgi:hypothetical protein
MTGAATLDDRHAFAERLRIQLASRYREARVEVEPTRFALRVQAPGTETTLPLSPLHHECLRAPDRAPALIAAWVASVERQLTPRPVSSYSPGRVLWCVRTREYLAGVSRVDDLLTADVAADLVAFVAEELPGSIMRGVPRQEWEMAGADDAAVRDAADRNTGERFTRLVERIRAASRIPADGWRMAGEPLFQSSMLVAGDVLAALVERAGGDVLLGVPDRGVALALPASLPSADRFHRRVLREWREAMNPCSHQVLITDGRSLHADARRRARPAAFVLPWLDE